jgi:hypothetical protein
MPTEPRSLASPLANVRVVAGHPSRGCFWPSCLSPTAGRSMMAIRHVRRQHDADRLCRDRNDGDTNRGLPDSRLIGSGQLKTSAATPTTIYRTARSTWSARAKRAQSARLRRVRREPPPAGCYSRSRAPDDHLHAAEGSPTATRLSEFARGRGVFSPLRGGAAAASGSHARWRCGTLSARIRLRFGGTSSSTGTRHNR